MRILQLLTIVAVVGTSVPFGFAQDASSFRTLYTFTGQPDGGDPLASLVIGSGGVLYGTTNSGGTSNLGTVFSLTPPASPGAAWTETVLHDFTGSDGANPQAGVVIGKNGVLYGTTSSGGASNAGMVFSLTPPASPGGVGPRRRSNNFTGIGGDGANPKAGVVIGSGAVLYGTTYNGGALGLGTAFELTRPAIAGGAWTETVLHNFSGGSDGAVPSAGLVSSGGVLYGTTHDGGTGTCTIGPQGTNLGCGTVYSLTPPSSPGGVWTEQVLHSFTGGRAGSSDGENPNAVVIGNGGVLYGTTEFGGTGGCGGGREGGFAGCGTVFELVPPASPGGVWTETVLYNFTGSNGDGANPVAPVVIGSGGVLYGGTSTLGKVFSLTPPAIAGGAWTETVLHSFKAASPQAGLVMSKNGVLYGTTSSGGASNAGTVFALKP